MPKEQIEICRVNNGRIMADININIKLVAAIWKSNKQFGNHIQDFKIQSKASSYIFYHKYMQFMLIIFHINFSIQNESVE